MTSGIWASGVRSTKTSKWSFPGESAEFWIITDKPEMLENGYIFNLWKHTLSQQTKSTIDTCESCSQSSHCCFGIKAPSDGQIESPHYSFSGRCNSYNEVKRRN